MCGIAGVIDYKNKFSDKSRFISMQKALINRGPDQQGIHITDNTVLIHARLCVIDIENGKQPMNFMLGNRKYTIVYNGELYNTEDIRAELKENGYMFIGHSDTEVLLKSYICWGEKCVNKLNGIFAFAVWEEHEQRLFAARDRMGVKPFFYTQLGNTFLFASEIKSLLAYPGVEANINIKSVAEIMLVGPGRTPGYGLFKDIYELPAANCGYFDEEGFNYHQYWHLQAKDHTDNLETTIETVKYLVTNAIERQLVSDVPIGTFLSGGLDSSIISSVANQYMQRQGKILKTFSLDYQDNNLYFEKSKFQPNSDTDFIFKMTDYLKCEHQLITLDTPALVESLYSAVDARDLPGMADVDSSLLLFCKEIKKQVTVALSGECADEIFGGYPWYRDEKVRMIDGFPWAQSTVYRHSFLQDEFADRILPKKYVYNKYLDTMTNTSKNPFDTPLEQRMKEMMKLNIDWFMQTLLDRKDRMSMYNALEVRVPFCDYRIAEYLYSVPWEMKDYKNYEKGLLREAMKEYLPNEILWRKKSPYPKTHNPNYLKTVRDRLSDVISNSNSPLLRIAKKSELEKLLTDNKSQPWYGQLMTTPQTVAYFLQIDYWMKKYNVKIVK